MPAADHGLRRCERVSASALQTAGNRQARVAGPCDAQASVVRRTRPAEAAQTPAPELSRRAERAVAANRLLHRTPANRLWSSGACVRCLGVSVTRPANRMPRRV